MGKGDWCKLKSYLFRSDSFHSDQISDWSPYRTLHCKTKTIVLGVTTSEAVWLRKPKQDVVFQISRWLNVSGDNPKTRLFYWQDVHAPVVLWCNLNLYAAPLSAAASLILIAVLYHKGLSGPSAYRLYPRIAGETTCCIPTCIHGITVEQHACCVFC